MQFTVVALLAESASFLANHHQVQRISDQSNAFVIPRCSFGSLDSLLLTPFEASTQQKTLTGVIPARVIDFLEACRKRAGSCRSVQ